MSELLNAGVGLDRDSMSATHGAPLMPSFALLLSLTVQQFEPFPPTPFDRVIPITIDKQDAVLAGHGRAERVTYKAEFSGTLHLWTKVEHNLDLYLRVTDPDGNLLVEDEDSGGGTTPYIRVEVEPGRTLVIAAALTSAEETGEVELHAIAAPETEATRSAAEKAKARILEVLRLRQAKEHEMARSLAQETLDQLTAVPGAVGSEQISGRLWELGIETYALSSLNHTKIAWGHALRHRSRVLPPEHSDLRASLLNFAATIGALGDLEGARALEERLLELLVDVLPDDHPDLQTVRLNLASTIEDLGDLGGARALKERVLEVRSRTLPSDDPDLQAAKLSLAATIKELGEFQNARELEEDVLEVFSRTLPDDDPKLQAARINMSNTLADLGDLASARSLEEKVLVVFTSTLPDDHLSLQAARLNLAVTMEELGDLRGAKALLEKALAVLSRTVPQSHPYAKAAQANLALTLKGLGDLAGASALEENLLEVQSRTLPDDHPDVQRARINLAATISELGDLARARALQEKVLEIQLRTLPGDSTELQRTRLNVANSIKKCGDLAGARALEAEALKVLSRTLPDDHSTLQAARQGLATTLKDLGDLPGARLLFEKLLDVRSRTLPEDHPDVQNARMGLALTLAELGDLQGARALEEIVLEVRSRTLPRDHPDVQASKLNLAITIKGLGEFQRAQSLEQEVLEVYSNTLSEDHPDLQRVRMNLAVTIAQLGDLQGARALFERVLEIYSKTLPESHPDLRRARKNVAATTLAQASGSLRGPGGEGERRGQRSEWRERGANLLRDLSHAQANMAREVRLNAPGREAEARCASLADDLGFTLSVALGFGGLDACSTLQPAAFLYSESTRNAGVSSSALGRRASQSEGYAEARAQLRRATDELARLVQLGASSAGYGTALAAREVAETKLLDLGRRASGGLPTSLELDLETLSTALKPGDAAVAYRSYTRFDLKWSAAPNVDGLNVREETSVESLCAFIVRPRDTANSADATSALTLLDLGPIEPITAAIAAWREALGTGEGRGVNVVSRAADAALPVLGAQVRKLVFDPLRAALGGARHAVVVLDGPLQLVPLDALPAGDDGTQRLGDALRIETRTTLGELLDAPLPLKGQSVLVGLGGAEFDGERAGEKPEGSAPAKPPGVIAAAEPAPVSSVRGILGDGAFEARFAPLPGTLREVEGLEQEFAKSVGAGATHSLLRGKEATKQALLAAAPRARWLHIATHGWFAPESIRSWEDRDPVDAKSSLALRQSGEETVKGMSPMMLCGLAFAGANLPEDAVGRAPGLLTADELSTLDLSNCELAVLSACDTARGEMRRAGQGVASLQKALQIAGARSVITSLWKVPDEATKDLMLDFYRRVWVDRKPKWQALWEAKLKLRNAKDERGAPKYTTRDWAAWVLTGEPE